MTALSRGHPIDLFGKFLLAGICGGNNMSLEGNKTKNPFEAKVCVNISF